MQARDVIVRNRVTGLNEFDMNGGLLDAREIQLAHCADTIAFMVVTDGNVQVARVSWWRTPLTATPAST